MLIGTRIGASPVSCDNRHSYFVLIDDNMNCDERHDQDGIDGGGPKGMQPLVTTGSIQDGPPPNGEWSGNWRRERFMRMFYSERRRLC